MKALRREMVFDRTLGKLRPMGRAPVLSSAALGWRGYHLEHQRIASLETRDVIWLNNMIFVHLSPIDLEIKHRSRFVPKAIKTGHITIVPTQGSTHCRTKDAVNVVALSIEPAFLATACGDLAAADDFELQLLNGVSDRFVEGVCLALRHEVAGGGKSGRLYADSLVTSLAIHLASQYAGRKTARHDPGPSPGVVRRAQRFITDRLAHDLTLNQIAGEVNLSPFHFSRLFKQHTGLSPYQFLLQQRIERAKQLLLRTRNSISAVALEVGFYDQSHFTLHFKRICRMTPGEFAAACHHRGGGKQADQTE